MRLLRILFCSVLLASAALAQSSGQSNSQSTSTAPQDPNTPPQNPLEEPKKVDPEQEANKPKPSTFDLGRGDTSKGQDQTLGEIRLMTRSTDIGGDTTRSFKSSGENNLAEINLFEDRRFLVNHRIQMLSMYRGTNDRSIDPEQSSLQKAYLRIYGPRDEYIFGDALINYSRLTFNQNIKGLSTAWKLGDRWKLSTAAGIFIDRWGSLYKDYSDTPSRPYTAVVAGARLEYAIRKDSSIGFNFSSSEDQEDSLPIAILGTPPLPTSNRIGSFDTRWVLKNIRLETEFAASSTNFDQRDVLGYQTDWGARMEGSWRLHKLSLRGSYVRYQPNFTAINARQISDLQDFVFRTSYELTTWLTVDGTARRSNNDLANQLTSELVTWGPEARLIFHDLPFYRRMVFETGYRHRITSASDSSVARFVRMPYAELTFPVHNAYFTLGWEQRQATDEITASQDSNTHRLYAGIRGNYEFHRWRFNPMVRFELERGAQRPDLLLVPPDLRLDRDSNRLGIAQVYIETPRWFIAELGFRGVSQTLFNPAGRGGNNRPSYRAALTYKVMNDENKLVIGSFERNFNYYYLSQSFDERQVGVTLVYKFGKRGR
jgi:hypothetical protein